MSTDTPMADDIVERLREAVSGEHLRGAPYTVAHNTPGALLLDAAALIESQAAEIARLRAGGCARDQTTTQFCAEAAKFAAETKRLRAELSAATGYMLNAKIDLETGAPKRTAITTIEGGLRRARAALPPATEGE